LKGIPKFAGTVVNYIKWEPLRGQGVSIAFYTRTADVLLMQLQGSIPDAFNAYALGGILDCLPFSFYPAHSPRICTSRLPFALPTKRAFAHSSLLAPYPHGGCILQPSLLAPCLHGGCILQPSVLASCPPSRALHSPLCLCPPKQSRALSLWLVPCPLCDLCTGLFASCPAH
jgi:hypothetical protein